MWQPLVDLGQCNVNGGGLGSLYVFDHQYGEPDASDYHGGGSALQKVPHPYCNVTVDVTYAVQAQVGQPYFQLRLSFHFVKTDGDGEADGVKFFSPTLTVNYIRGQ